MLKRLLSTGLNYLRGNALVGPNLIVYPDDVFLVSYPRSGNTWTRFLLANLVYRDQPATFVNIDRRIADIYVQSQLSLLRLPRPRILKSHQPFDPRYRKVIYVVRDPRDVAISFYYYNLKRRHIADEYPIERFVSNFVRGGWEPALGSWAENVTSWLAVRYSMPSFLLLRYEDLLEDTMRELGTISRFLGLCATPDEISRAVELSSADRMRALEKARWVGGNHRGQHLRRDIMFVRTAKSGEWRSGLPGSAEAEIESAWGTVMEELGYKLNTVRTAREPA